MEVNLQGQDSVWIPIIFIAAAAIFSLEGPAGFLVLLVILIHGSPWEQWCLATVLNSLYLGSHLPPFGLTARATGLDAVCVGGSLSLSVAGGIPHSW